MVTVEHDYVRNIRAANKRLLRAQDRVACPQLLLLAHIVFAVPGCLDDLIASEAHDDGRCWAKRMHDAKDAREESFAMDFAKDFWGFSARAEASSLPPRKDNDVGHENKMRK